MHRPAAVLLVAALAALSGLAAAQPAFAEDAMIAAGKLFFGQRCQVCHNPAAAGGKTYGPPLAGVVGRKAGSLDGFAYSDAMAKHKAEAPTWGYDQINSFITAPAKYVPGTKMSFAGIRDTQTRINLIAWLRTQGSGGFAIPAPDPTRQPGAAAPAAGAPATGEAPVTEGAAATEATGTTPAAGAPAASQATPAAPPAATASAPPNT